MDNIYMTDKQIEQMAVRVANIVIQALDDKQREWDKALVADIQDQQSEEKLLSDLAQAMTALDYNLKLENYPRCSELQATIIDLEKQLKNLK